MIIMRTIIKYVVLDLVKNKIVLVYTFFLLAMSLGIFSMDENATKGIMSLMNLVLIFIPLVSIIFSTIYVYNSSEFIELLVAQPLKRKTLFNGMDINSFGIISNHHLYRYCITCFSKHKR